MAKYSFNFTLFCEDEPVWDSKAEVSLTKKDFAEIEQFIIEHKYSGEFVDIPTHIYDKCCAKAFDVVFKNCPSQIEVDESCYVEPETLLPESFLNQLSPETAHKIKENTEFI